MRVNVVLTGVYMRTYMYIYLHLVYAWLDCPAYHDQKADIF